MSNKEVSNKDVQVNETSQQANSPDENNNKSALNIAISKNTKILALFAIGCTAIVGLVSELTKEKIKQQEQQQLLNTLHSIIEPSSYDNNIANDCIMMSAPALGSNRVQTA